MTRGVRFTEEGARRVIAATRAYERGNRDQPPIKFRTGGDDEPLRLGKTTAQWTKGAVATITLYESGTPGNEVTASPAETLEGCINKFGDVPANKWVAVMRGPFGRWYLIAAEC